MEVFRSKGGIRSSQQLSDRTELESLARFSGREAAGKKERGNQGKILGFMPQLILIWRLAMRRRIKEHPLLTILPFLATLTFSLLVAFTWFQLPKTANAASAIFRVITLHSVYFTLMSNLGLFTIFSLDRQDRLGLKPSQGLSFSPVATWFGRYFAEIPLRLLQVILSCLIIYPIVGLRPGIEYYMLYQTALMLQVFGNVAFGMVVAALFGDKLVAVWGASFINSFNYLFSGVAYTAAQVTWVLLWIRFLSVSFYTDQILIHDQFSGHAYSEGSATGNDVLDETGWLVLPLSIAISCLVALIILFNILGPTFLWLTSRH